MRNLSSVLLAAVLVLGAAGPAEAGWEEGVQAFQGGNFSVAAQEFQAVTEQSPDYAPAHFMLGQALDKLNRNEDALDAFRQAYDLQPSNPEFQFALANAYLEVRRYADAAELYQRIDPSSLKSNYQAAYNKNRAVALEKSGRRDEAFAAKRDTARSSPNDASAQYAYGVAAFNAGQTSEAVAALGKAVQLEPKTKYRESYAKALIRLARQDASRKRDAYAKVVEQAKALVAAESSYENLLLLGEAQLGSKQYRDAVATLQRAAGQKGDWLPHFYMSQAQTALEQYAAAEDSLQKALAAGPSGQNERRVYRQIGFVNEKMKEYDQAKVAYTRAGDQASVQRVEENQRIAEENQRIEEHNRQVEEMKREQEALEKELEELESPPPR